MSRLLPLEARTACPSCSNWEPCTSWGCSIHLVWLSFQNPLYASYHHLPQYYTSFSCLAHITWALVIYFLLTAFLSLFSQQSSFFFLAASFGCADGHLQIQMCRIKQWQQRAQDSPMCGPQTPETMPILLAQSPLPCFLIGHRSHLLIANTMMLSNCCLWTPGLGPVQSSWENTCD